MQNWFPHESLNGFKFGESIKDIEKREKLIIDNGDEQSDWTGYYSKKYDIEISIENGKVICMTAYREFIYKGKNLIGLNTVELGSILGTLPDKNEYLTDDSITGIEYRCWEYDIFGLQVYVQEGKVVYISCFNHNEDE